MANTVIYRLDHGPLSGLVARNEHGPWRGWYTYSWTAGERSGGAHAMSRDGEIAAVDAACRDYFRDCNPVHISGEDLV